MGCNKPWQKGEQMSTHIHTVITPKRQVTITNLALSSPGMVSNQMRQAHPSSSSSFSCVMPMCAARTAYHENRRIQLRGEAAIQLQQVSNTRHCGALDDDQVLVPLVLAVAALDLEHHPVTSWSSPRCVVVGHQGWWEDRLLSENLGFGQWSSIGFLLCTSEF